jgi:hypothetical protein
MEIVLAVALASVVMYLLTTAIELYMVRVDSSRSRVESAQLARTILDRIAADLAATRLYAPSLGSGQGSGGQGSGGATSGGNSGQMSGGSAPVGGQAGSSSGGGPGSSGTTSGMSPGASGGMASSAGVAVQGIYGTNETIRIDRSAYANWQRATRLVQPDEGATAADVPLTVRYYYADGTRLTSDQLAVRGVSVDGSASRIAGLYRETTPTAALANQSDPLASSTESNGTKTELLAPEVVKLEIAYYDGKQALEAWDSYQSQGLPAGVEIILTVHEPRFQDDASTTPRPSESAYSANELVEYRRFVRLPYLSPSPPAESLLPASGSNGGNQCGSGQQSSQGAGGANNHNNRQQGGGSGSGSNSSQGGGNGR